MRSLVRGAALLVCLAATAFADRETALFSAKRAEKSLAAKKFDEAESLYRKALEEDETYLPARYGRAQALVGAGHSGPAVEELRKFLGAARADAALPAEWKALVPKAEKQLADIDSAGAALQKVVDDYRDGLLALAQRWMTKDPAVAQRALRRVLKLAPGNAKAAELLEKMGLSASSDVIDLFDGKSLSGWESANSPIWSVVDGELVADVRDSTYACRSLRTFEGNFDVHLEARVVEQYPGDSFFALRPCLKSSYDSYSVGMINGRFWWYDRTGENKADEREVASLTAGQLKKPVKVKEWNTYELRLRGNEAVALINGDVVAKETRPAGRKGGFVG